MWRTSLGLNRGLLLFLCSLYVGACADIGEFSDENDAQEKYTSGVSSKSVYECVTATIASDGSKWTYKVNEVNNLLNNVYMKVTQMKPGETVATDHGTYTLTKSTTDTYGNGNLKMTFITKRQYNRQDANGAVQSVIEKSISVEHNTTPPLFADYQNGYCKESRLEYSADGNSGTQRDPLDRIEDIRYLNGEWYLDPNIISDRATISSSGTIKIEHVGSEGLFSNSQNTEDTMNFSYKQKCHVLADLGVNDYIADSNIKKQRLLKFRAVNRLHPDPYDPINYQRPMLTPKQRAGNAILLLLDVLNYGLEIVRVIQCAVNPEAELNKTQILRISSGPNGEIDGGGWFSEPRPVTPQWFIDACKERQGSYPVFAYSPWTTTIGYPTTFFCFNHFPARGGLPEAIEVLVSGKEPDEIGDWTRWLRR